MSALSLDDLIAHGLRGKRVLLRADLNVPLDATGHVRDATRLERLLPSLRALCAHGARIALLSHFGRPQGVANPEMSLAPMAKALSTLCGQGVHFAPDCIGETATHAINTLKDGEICVLENTRFHAGEEKNDAGFAAALAENGDFYVNDAFSAAHRAHASTHALAQILPAFAGRAMQAELTALDAALGHPQKPLAAIIGGAKISTKLELLHNLTQKVDILIIGGGMANTCLAAQNIEIGNSLCETSMLETAREILTHAEKNKCRIILPRDGALAPEFAAGQNARIAPINAIPTDQMILDCGPDSINDICTALDEARTLIWNGPLGAFEIPPFDKATVHAAQYAAQRTRAGALISIAGGGDTVAALNHAQAADEFTYISTAGGAFLEWLEGKSLPGVAVLNERK